MHLVSQPSSLLRLEHRSGAVVFVDVIAAFYSTLCQLLFERVQSWEEFLAQLGHVGFDQDELRGICAPAQSGAQGRRFVHSNHQRACIANGQNGTWFSVNGLPQVQVLGRGSRPGDPLADIIFAMEKHEHRPILCKNCFWTFSENVKQT